MYFREFGIPARIARCYNVDQLEEKIAEFNGKKNCYTSVYVFDDTTDPTEGKTSYDSAVLNTKNYPKDLSYRGEGLSNEYRLPLCCGLIGWFEKRYVKKILDAHKDKV